jgi:enoyl-CoA hydratase
MATRRAAPSSAYDFNDAAIPVGMSYWAKLDAMAKVLYEKDGRIGRITLNRPEVMNAIDDDLPVELADCVARANADPGVHVIVLSGAGRPSAPATTSPTTRRPTAGARPCGDPGHAVGPDEGLRLHDAQHRTVHVAVAQSYRPVIAKVHGFAVAGGSDIALCSDMIVMAEDAEIGYMPVRVWGCPTTAMWVYRLGPERAKRMLFTGDKIDGRKPSGSGSC